MNYFFVYVFGCLFKKKNILGNTNHFYKKEEYLTYNDNKYDFYFCVLWYFLYRMVVLLYIFLVFTGIMKQLFLVVNII